MKNASKPQIKLPVVRGKQAVFPEKPLCPWCGEHKVYEPHSMAILNAGAMHSLGNERYEMATDAAAFLTLIWHGAHLDVGGVGQDAGISATVDIADMVVSGQFDLYFCSTGCLRGFLNYCVDELERQIESSRAKK